MATSDLLRTVSPLIGDLGAHFYFTKPTMQRGGEFGLDPLTWYVVGRGGSLGNVPAAVVHAAFGYFNPSMIAGAWAKGTAANDAATIGREHFAMGAEDGRLNIADVAGLDALCAALGKVNDAANPEGLALYSGYRTLDLVDDVPGRTMQLLIVLRELRGSAHLAALRAAGVDTLAAHAAKRPDMWEAFGWSREQMPEVTEAVRDGLREAESMTNRIVAPAFEVLGADEQDALATGLQAVKAALA